MMFVWFYVMPVLVVFLVTIAALSGKNVIIVLYAYGYNILDALSQLANTVLFYGDPDESLSGHFGKLMQDGNRLALFVAGLMPQWFVDHCVACIEPDRGDRAVLTRKNFY